MVSREGSIQVNDEIKHNLKEKLLTKNMSKLSKFYSLKTFFYIVLFLVFILEVTLINQTVMVIDSLVSQNNPFDPIPNLNPNPIIGLVSQPVDEKYINDTNYTFISDIDIKFLEQSGAQIIPIQYDLPIEKIKEIIKQINGIFLPGGNSTMFTKDLQEFSDYGKKINKIIQEAVDQNRNATFPIWGTCQGMEQIITYWTELPQILEMDFKDFFKNHKLNNMKDNGIYESLDKNIINYIQNHESAFFNHDNGISVNRFKTTPVLEKMFDISSTVTMPNGIEIVGSISGKKLPIYAVSYHPESVQFVHDKNHNTDQNIPNIQFSQNHSNFLKYKSQQNFNKFQNEQDKIDLLQMNYQNFKILDDQHVRVFKKNQQN